MKLHWSLWLPMVGLLCASWLTQRIVHVPAPAVAQEPPVMTRTVPSRPTVYWKANVMVRPEDFDSLRAGETWRVRVEASRPDSGGPVLLQFVPVRPTSHVIPR